MKLFDLIIWQMAGPFVIAYLCLTVSPCLTRQGGSPQGTRVPWGLKIKKKKKKKCMHEVQMSLWQHCLFFCVCVCFFCFFGPLGSTHIHSHTLESFSQCTEYWNDRKDKESNKAISGWRLKGLLQSKDLIYEAQAWLGVGAMVTQWMVRPKEAVK